MTNYFTRWGDPVTTKVFKPEGSKRRAKAVVSVPCGRCGGAGGAEQWRHTGWTCFQCGGQRFFAKTVSAFTAEELAKLNAKRDAKTAALAEAAAARAAEAAAKHAAEIGEFRAKHAALIASVEANAERSTFLKDLINKLDNRLWSSGQIDAAAEAVARFAADDAKRAASGYVGEVGERVEVKVTVERVYVTERPKFNAPWLTENWNLVSMRDAAGNAVVTKGRFYAEKGATLTLKGTVKEHTQYKGEKQTVLQRVKESAT